MHVFAFFFLLEKLIANNGRILRLIIDKSHLQLILYIGPCCWIGEESHGVELAFVDTGDDCLLKPPITLGL